MSDAWTRPAKPPEDFARPAEMLRDEAFEADMADLASRIDQLPEGSVSVRTTNACGSTYALTLRDESRDGGALEIPLLAGWPLPGPGFASNAEARPDPGTMLKAVMAARRIEEPTPFADRATAIGPDLSALLLTDDADLWEGLAPEGQPIPADVGMEPDDGLLSLVLEPDESSDLDRTAWHPPASVSTAIPITLKPRRSGDGWRLTIDAKAVEGSGVVLGKPSGMEAIRSAATYRRD
jgi:hypothetical protein